MISIFWGALGGEGAQEGEDRGCPGWPRQSPQVLQPLVLSAAGAAAAAEAAAGNRYI